MNDEDENRPLNVNDYNYEEGKLVASIRWLITRVYEDADVPDRLRELFVRDEKNTLHLTPTVTAILLNGSLYTQAASKILRDSSLIAKSVGAVLKSLSTADIEVRDAEGSLITEESLTSTEPFQLNTHLSLIDALMAAHMKSIVSIDRVVQAVSAYTSVDKREEPLDCVDALLFWVNKICLLVRDDVERQGIQLKGADNDAEPTIPEMEDLYSDLCDGTCISAVVAFYRPHEVDLRDINFNDPISISDCRYNLGILKNFCENCLPWNVFHFEIEDILVLHESLQSNVNAFLADLFFFFEPVPEPSPAVSSPTQRRFVPIQGIPELRAQNVAHRPLHPPKTNRNSYGSSQRDRTMSVASADSLMTGRSGDSLRYSNAKPNQLPPGTATTNFGNLNMENSGGNESASPASNLKAYTEMRLAFEEKRREHERKTALNSALKEEERQKMGKNAFFKLMSRNATADSARTATSPDPVQRPYEGASTARELELSAQLENIREELKSLKMQQQSMSNLTNVGVSHATSQPSLYSDLYAQQAAPPPPQYPGGNFASPYATLPHKSPHAFADPMPARNPYGAYGPPGQTFFPPQLGENPQHHYAMPSGSYGGQPLPPFYQQSPPAYGLQPSNSHGALNYAAAQQQALQQQQYAAQMPPLPPPHYGANPMSYSMFEPHQMNGPEMMTSPPHQMHDSYAQNTPTSFRLHQPYADSSRLDPSLEINRNFTNWGLAYKSEEKPQRKTWATFDAGDASVADGANGQRFGGHGANGKTPADEPRSPPSSSNATPNGHPSSDLNQSSQQSPPRDPEFRSPPANHAHTQPPSTNEAGGTTFPAIPPAETAKSNGGLKITEGAEPTAEMEAKRQALLMSQMKRKEKISAAKEDKRDEWDEKREEEARKQEMADQRKLEREMKRQKLLEDYKRRKLEQDLGESMSGSLSARVSSTASLSRGRSQPPFSRPKSQSNMSAVQVQNFQRPNRTKSSVAADENSVPRINVPALADPTLKLYAKHKLKSNRALILNAIQFSVFPGAVSNDQRNKVQAALAQSDAKHFLVLFRDQRHQYRGLYTWDQQSDTVYRIDGVGPKIVKEEMMLQMFKYDSGNKQFSHIPTKNLSATIDGFTLLDTFWAKPKIPHSRGV